MDPLWNRTSGDPLGAADAQMNPDPGNHCLSYAVCESMVPMIAYVEEYHESSSSMLADTKLTAHQLWNGC